MPKRQLEDDVEETGAVKAAPTPAENRYYPGDILKDKKTGKKATFVNEYGTNGRAIIVMPQGMSRSELWDASKVEVVKRVKRPVIQQEVAPQDPVLDGLRDDDDADIDEDDSIADD